MDRELANTAAHMSGIHCMCTHVMAALFCVKKQDYSGATGLRKCSAVSHTKCPTYDDALYAIKNSCLFLQGKAQTHKIKMCYDVVCCVCVFVFYSLWYVSAKNRQNWIMSDCIITNIKRVTLSLRHGV